MVVGPPSAASPTSLSSCIPFHSKVTIFFTPTTFFIENWIVFVTDFACLHRFRPFWCFVGTVTFTFISRFIKNVFGSLSSIISVPAIMVSSDVIQCITPVWVKEEITIVYISLNGVVPTTSEENVQSTNSNSA